MPPSGTKLKIDYIHPHGRFRVGNSNDFALLALATDPEIVLFDEPTSALDPIATARIEELIHELKSRVTILIVTHNMQQAGRVADYTAFMYLGELVEYDKTAKIFTKPTQKLTEQYITGCFG